MTGSTRTFWGAYAAHKGTFTNAAGTGATNTNYSCCGATGTPAKCPSAVYTGPKFVSNRVWAKADVTNGDLGTPTNANGVTNFQWNFEFLLAASY